jgi:heterodisulfide reductase subunit D
MEIDIRKVQETNAFSCLECGKCTGTCPVSRYSETFSPRQILTRSVHNTHPQGFDVKGLWSCLTCMRCDEICPSEIKYSDLILMLRQFKGIENRDGTCSHGGILESIAKIMTTPNLKQQRLDWLTNEYQTSNDSEYLYFMGCLPYFDALFSSIDVQSLNIAKSTMKILNYFDIKPQLLADEKCCGHDLYWNGDINNFTKLAKSNIEAIKQSGAKKIVTACPECYRTLKVDYQKNFGSQAYEVFHISEFIDQKLEGKNHKIKTDEQKITFQDPCRLGRHLNIYEAPRNALSYLTGLDLKEMAHHHKRSICCGVSGWMNCSQVSKQIQTQRLGEAKLTGAETLVTACAKCQIHFKCAMQDEKLNLDVGIEIKDLTEVFAESLH